MKIAIAGASGFIGSKLLPYLQDHGHVVFPHPRKGTLPEGLDVVINLAGESLYGKWTEEKKERIRESRISTTKLLCDQILSRSRPPQLYIGASAIGYYGNRGQEALTEESPVGTGFLAELCQEWENQSSSLQAGGIRVVHARFGIVLGEGGGVLERMLPIFKLGLGGKLGSGEQIMSWIALADLMQAFSHLFQQGELKGAVNFVAPNPVSNATLTDILAKNLKRSTFLKCPEWLLSLFFGEGKELFLNSANVVPKRLLESGYQFIYPDLETYLPIILERKKNKKVFYN